MHYYDVTITSSGGEEIKLVTKTEQNENDALISGVKVAFDTLDDNVNQKSNAMLARIEVRGAITANNVEALSKIVNWMKDFTPAAYRKVKIIVYEDISTILRTYEIDEVFPRDYDEMYGSLEDDTHKGDPRFVLKMTQKQNKLQSIRIN